jgi:hypothetical protein
MPKKYSQNSSRRRSKTGFRFTLIVKHAQSKWPSFKLNFHQFPAAGQWLELPSGDRYTIRNVSPSEAWTLEERGLLERFGARMLWVALVEDAKIPRIFPMKMRVKCREEKPVGNY